MTLRGAIQARLRGEDKRVEPAVLASMGLEEFSRSDLSARVESRVLGEAVLFAGAMAKVPEGEELVVYRGEELLLVQGIRAPEDLRFVHEVKRLFNGRIIERVPHG